MGSVCNRVFIAARLQYPRWAQDPCPTESERSPLDVSVCNRVFIAARLQYPRWARFVTESLSLLGFNTYDQDPFQKSRSYKPRLSNGPPSMGPRWARFVTESLSLLGFNTYGFGLYQDPFQKSRSYKLRLSNGPPSMGSVCNRVFTPDRLQCLSPRFFPKESQLQTAPIERFF